jgi:ribosomal protein S18 acetylase RimI-like enzyme
MAAMTAGKPPGPEPRGKHTTRVERLTAFSDDDLDDLCAATIEAVKDGNGFGWLKPPRRGVLERYWRGVLLVPERELYVARLDGHIVGSAQLFRPTVNNEAGAHAAQAASFFIAPWARGHGLARGLLRAIEDSARAQGFKLLDLDVRETQTAAIQLFEDWGFRRWGTKERYALVDGRYVTGYFYSKILEPQPGAEASESVGPKKP